MLTRRIKIQLLVFAVVSVVAGAVMFFDYMQCADRILRGRPLHGHSAAARGRRPVPRRATSPTAESRSVGYRTCADRIAAPRRCFSWIRMSTSPPISAPRCTACPRSASNTSSCCRAPRSGPSLQNGDVIPVDRSYVPPDINSLLQATNRGLNAIPRDNLKTVVDESYVAVRRAWPGTVPAGQRARRIWRSTPARTWTRSSP